MIHLLGGVFIMKVSSIDLNKLDVKGKVKTTPTDNGIDVWTTHSITSIAFNLKEDCFKKHMISFPNKCCIPFRLDMTVKLDFPSLIVLLGDGHITFASTDNRKLEDIVKPSGKPNQDNYLYNNQMPLGEFTDISITYNFDEMQILIGGEERFYSLKLPYMKAKDLIDRNTEGFGIGLAISKLSTLSIKSITVIEFDQNIPVNRGSFIETPTPKLDSEHTKPTFETIISGLHQDYRSELIELDKFLKSLQPLKFKRQIDKSGKITYLASNFGISYIIQVFDNQLSHNFGWYIVTNGKPETWHRKADYMEELLAYIAQSDSKLAERIFYALNDCVFCYGSRCLAKTLYEFNGQKRLACHGRVLLRICHDDFLDVREFFRYLNGLMEFKIAEGSLQTEKILLMKD